MQHQDLSEREFVKWAEDRHLRFPVAERVARTCRGVGNATVRKLVSLGLVSLPWHSGLSVRVQNCINAAAIDSMDQLREAIRSRSFSCARIRNLGPKTFIEVCKFVGLD